MSGSSRPSDSGGDWLAVSVSARALAAALRRAGRFVFTLDGYADTDTRALARWAEVVPQGREHVFDAEALLEMAGRPMWRDLPLVYGSGFEDRPDLLARLAAGRELAGNPPEVVARVKDPEGWAALLARLGIPHPELARGPVAEPADWLVKRRGGAGGAHIRPAVEAVAPPGGYLQRRVGGRAVSAMFLADGRRAIILGFTEQWCDPTPEAPFRYAGAAGPVTPPHAADLEAAVRAVVAAAGLVGLNSADFLVREDGFHLLEVNPRPGATLDLYDRPPRPGLFELHRRACRGELPGDLPALPDAMAATIVFATQDVLVPFEPVWPAWTADRPRPGAVMFAGNPICTVFASAPTVESARETVRERAARVRHWLAESKQRAGMPLGRSSP